MSDPEVTEIRAAGMTAVFECDLRKFPGNPFYADTPFGQPCTMMIGDACEERDALAVRVAELEAQLSSVVAAAVEAAYEADSLKPAIYNVPLGSLLEHGLKKSLAITRRQAEDRRVMAAIRDRDHARHVWDDWDGITQDGEDAHRYLNRIDDGKYCAV